jgi:hypothetical protein
MIIATLYPSVSIGQPGTGGEADLRALVAYR